MKKILKLTPLIFVLMVGSLSAQADANAGYLHGHVYGVESHGTHMDTVSLMAANVYWRDTPLGTTTDANGMFHLEKPDNNARWLVVNYVGYEDESWLIMPGDNNLQIYLKTQWSAEEVHVHAEMPHSMHRQSTAVNTEVITGTGLTQLACCSLAESFENTTSVDVEQSDAVSGARRIKMLGLAGFYTQMMIEKKPVMRGLVNPFALEYIPGFWMQAVDISKGTASVGTGYESITGQINVELKKPENSDPFAVNGFLSSMGKLDLAVLGAHQFNPRLSTMLLTFGTTLQQRYDSNDDSFIDMPLLQQFNLMNRWKYNGDRFRGQIGIKVISDLRQGGQMDFEFDDQNTSTGIYGYENDVDRVEIYTKSGISLDDQGSSIGLTLSAFQHRVASFGGLKTYSGEESSLWANLVYNKVLVGHLLSAGLSYQLDDRQETYQDLDFDNSESVPGVFGEYTYQAREDFTALFGLRYDQHDRFGGLLTPRAHLSYRPTDMLSIRTSAGKGFRNPQIFSDNPAILVSSKELVIQEEIELEEAWNAGFQVIQKFTVGADKPAELVVDYYRTEFQNQLVVDMDQSAEHIYLYNLDGQSFSNAFQVELSADVLQGLEILTALRYNDVQSTYNGELKPIPLNSTYKGLVVLSYSTDDDVWQFDLTTQLNGRARLPNTSGNPVEYQLDEYSPAFTMMFAQLKRDMGEWEVYAGVENLTDFRQEDPILAWDDPFGPYFDSSLIWGPTFGRRFYVGFRFN